MNSEGKIVSAWRKSRRSGGGGGAQCVELACTEDEGRAVRDSKAPEAGQLTFGPKAWAAFAHRVTE